MDPFYRNPYPKPYTPKPQFGPLEWLGPVLQELDARHRRPLGGGPRSPLGVSGLKFRGFGV